MSRLSLIHLTVDQPTVVNHSIVRHQLLQRLSELLAVKIDSNVPVGVNVTACRY